MKKTPHKTIIARVSLKAWKTLEREKRRTGATFTWLVQEALMQAYGGKQDDGESIK